MNITLNGKDLGPILSGSPSISDQLESVCRTMEFSVKGTASLDNKLGQVVDLWYGGKRWFTGTLRKRGRKHDGIITYLVYDPMIFLTKNVDDFYFDGQTAKQGIKTLAEASAIKVRKLADTGVVLPPLYYQGAEADKVAVDQLVRTYQENKKKFWIRYNPDYGDEGLDLFERVVPAKLWSFQVGINLTSASLEESIEETITVVKLINRDTGKVVQLVDAVKLKAYGKAVHFEEIDKDKADTMDTLAQTLLNNLSGVALTQQIEGINPDNVMPQLFSGDYVYVEEKNTKIMGGYHIRNITHTFVSDTLITISADIEKDAFVPDVQFEDATENPDEQDTGAGTSDDTGSGSGLSDAYLTEFDTVMDDYGADGTTKVLTTEEEVKNTPGSPGYQAPTLPEPSTTWDSYMNLRLAQNQQVTTDITNSGGVIN